MPIGTFCIITLNANHINFMLNFDVWLNLFEILWCERIRLTFGCFFFLLLLLFSWFFLFSIFSKFFYTQWMSIGTRYHNCLFFYIFLGALLWNENSLGISCKFKTLVHLWKNGVSTFHFLLQFFFHLLCFIFQFIFISCIWKGWKCIPSNNHHVRMHKTSHVNSKIGPKWGTTTIYPQSIAVCFPFSQNFNNKDKRKQWKQTKKKTHTHKNDVL